MCQENRIKYRLFLTTLIIFSVIGFLTILLSTRHYGIGVSPDSVTYIATARHIASGMGAIRWDGAPLIEHAPLYPALLAMIAYVFKVDPISSAPIVNSVLYGLVVYLSGLLFFRYLKSYAFTILGAVSVLVGIPLIRVSLWAWSELFFIFFILLYLISFELYLTKGDIKFILLLSCIVSLLCLIRYIGIIFIFTSIVGIMIFRQNNLKEKFKHLFIFVLISVLPISMWIIRNYLLSGTLFGPRTLSAFTLSQNLAFTFNTLLSWYIPERISEHRSILMLLSAVIGFLFGLSTKGNYNKIKVILIETRLLSLFIIVYLSFLVVSSTLVAYDRIGHRLLSPIFIPLTLLIFIFASKISLWITEKLIQQKCLNLLILAIISIWLIYPTRASIFQILDLMDQGLGYNNKFWKNSQTIKYLSQNRALISKFDIIYSNAPDAIYILAGFKSEMIPSKIPHHLPKIRINNLVSLKGLWPEKDNSILIYFKQVNWTYLFTLNELQTIANIQQIISFEDGVIYHIMKK